MRGGGGAQRGGIETNLGRGAAQGAEHLSGSRGGWRLGCTPPAGAVRSVALATHRVERQP